MDVTRKRQLFQPGELQELLLEKRRSLASKLGTTEDFSEFNTGPIRELSTPKPKKKRTLRKIGAPIKTLIDSPKGHSKSKRRMIIGEESPEVEHFPHNPNAATSPLGSPAENTRATIRRMTTNNKSPMVERSAQVEESQQSPIASPNGGIRRSLRLQGIIENSPKANQATDVSKVGHPQKPNDTVEPSMENKKQTRGKTKMKGVAYNQSPIEVKFNSKGQPIGEASIGLSSFLGALVREIVPVTINDWRKITPEMTEVLWKSVQV